jgi:hypothetical protein
MGVREDFFAALGNESEYETYHLNLEETRVIIWVQPGSVSATELTEGRTRGKPIGGPYSARLDRGLPVVGKDDLHVFLRGNELFAMYSDGTRKHGKPGLRIPNQAADGIRKHFPHFTIPPDQILEVVAVPGGAQFLTEEH